MKKYFQYATLFCLTLENSLNVVTIFFILLSYFAYLPNSKSNSNLFNDQFGFHIGSIIFVYDLSRIPFNQFWEYISKVLGNSITLAISLLFISGLNICFAMSFNSYLKIV